MIFAGQNLVPWYFGLASSAAVTDGLWGQSPEISITNQAYRIKPNYAQIQIL